MAAAEDRHSKLEQVLTLMAEKFCNVSGNGSDIVCGDQQG